MCLTAAYSVNQTTRKLRLQIQSSLRRLITSNIGDHRIEPMDIDGISFATTDWSTVPITEHKGEKGTAYWRTCQFGPIRVRMVEYSPGYLADHWCSKGHILLLA